MGHDQGRTGKGIWIRWTMKDDMRDTKTLPLTLVTALMLAPLTGTHAEDAAKPSRSIRSWLPGWTPNSSPGKNEWTANEKTASHLRANLLDSLNHKRNGLMANDQK